MKLIPLTQGQSAQVDDEDFEWLSQWKWFTQRGKDGRFYAVRSVTISNQPRYYKNGKSRRGRVLMHSAIMDALPRQSVDHKDGDGLNNQRGNLRFCDATQNNANRGPTKKNKLGIKGVHQIKATGRFRASIQVQRKRVDLGCFATAEEAHAAYVEAAEHYFGEFARAS